jgi:hypothetical protein
MTAAFEKGILWATPAKVAEDIDRAMTRGLSKVYTPWYWGWIMLVIMALPEKLFARFKF